MSEKTNKLILKKQFNTKIKSSSLYNSKDSSKNNSNPSNRRSGKSFWSSYSKGKSSKKYTSIKSSSSHCKSK